MVTLKSLVQAGLYPDEESASRKRCAHYGRSAHNCAWIGLSTSFALVNFHWLTRQHWLASALII